MRLFSHVTTEYSCIKQCGYRRSEISPSLSPFHIITTVIAAIPIGITLYSKLSHLPWYHLFSIITGEFLLLFIAGFILTIFYIPRSILYQRCKSCGASVEVFGWHFDPLRSEKPHWTDFAITAIFIGLNVIVCIVILGSK